MATNARNHEFDDAAIVVYRGVAGHRNPPGTRKLWNVAHENGQKCPKSRVLMRPLESCTGVHGASKSSRDQKTVDCSPRKRPEMTKSRVLTIPLESCTGSHGASKSSRDPKTVDYRLGKRPEMPEIMSFDNAAKVMYRGSRGIEILLGPKNRGI